MDDVKIKRKSWIWNLVPLAGRHRFSSTIGTTIYLTPKRYDNYHSASPSVTTRALVAHEKVHVGQYQADKGFPLKYLLSRKARLNYELEAYAEQIRFSIQFYPGRKEKYIQQKAKVLSSTRYLLFMDNEEVHRKLEAKVNALIEAEK